MTIVLIHAVSACLVHSMLTLVSIGLAHVGLLFVLIVVVICQAKPTEMMFAHALILAGTRGRALTLEHLVAVLVADHLIGSGTLHGGHGNLVSALCFIVVLGSYLSFACFFGEVCFIYL